MRWIAAGVILVLLGIGSPAASQERPGLRVVDAAGADTTLELSWERGFAAVPASALETLGWSVEPADGDLRLTGPEGTSVRIRVGSPFLRWGDEVLQLTDAPFADGDRVLVPAQVLTDFLPRRFPDRYAFDGPSGVLRASRGDEAGAGGEVGPPSPEPVPALRTPSEYDGVRVVVIDAGHGGRDPGSASRSGVREKTVALAVARAAARALEAEPGLEIRMVRDDDTFVPVWDRGALATEMKGDRPGVLLSIHANSFSSPARGFETYFLSEARTEHERRVAAIENAPLEVEEGEGESGEDLGFILRELRNLDHQHWSAFLAEMVQEEVDRVHPGPNRGVKQAPLAVITNALMPSVLVEVGYLSHPEEARLLARPEFQEEAGQAIAQAVLRFFERYPPGSWSRTGEGG